MEMYGEIQYHTPKGMVHSDFSFVGDLSNASYRKLLHTALDEYIDHVAIHGISGGFYVGDAHLKDDCND